MHLTSQYNPEKDTVALKCPICGHKESIVDFQARFPKEKINTHKGVTTVAFKAECGHTYMFYVDKTFNIRGYHSADFAWAEIEGGEQPATADEVLAEIKVGFGGKFQETKKLGDLPDYHKQVEHLIDEDMPELEDLPDLPELKIDELPDLPEITVEERKEIEAERQEIEKSSLSGAKLRLNDEERAALLKKMKFYKSRIRKTEDLIDELRLPKTEEEKKNEWVTRKLERLLLTKKKLKESYAKLLEEAMD